MHRKQCNHFVALYRACVLCTRGTRRGDGLMGVAALRVSKDKARANCTNVVFCCVWVQIDVWMGRLNVGGEVGGG